MATSLEVGLDSEDVSYHKRIEESEEGGKDEETQQNEGAEEREGDADAVQVKRKTTLKLKKVQGITFKKSKQGQCNGL